MEGGELFFLLTAGGASGAAGKRLAPPRPMRSVTASATAADLLTQTLAFTVKLLNCGFGFSARNVDSQHFVDRFGNPGAAGCEPLLNHVALFANQTNVQHGAV